MSHIVCTPAAFRSRLRDDTDRDSAPTPARITVAAGDGIGPEISQAVLRILSAAGAALVLERVHVGEAIYRGGIPSGIPDDAWDSLRRTRVFLKGPITTPQGGGYKSLNVTLRKALSLYANVRPCTAYAPFVATRHPALDVVVVRENEEDTYAGIEHRQTREVTQCLKLISRPGCERVARYAFEYARRHGRRKVTCMTKDNIMKLTDGLFHRVFDETARDYPEIETEHLIIDIGTALMADQPERFDVVLTPNLYGDILSDVVAQLAGSVGLAGSANIGAECAMFEAVHGSAPNIAGQDIANPSGLLQAAVLMLAHLGQTEVAARVQNAWLVTLEGGVHTADIHGEASARAPVGTQAFADAVIERLGREPETLRPATFASGSVPTSNGTAPGRTDPRTAVQKVLVGVDVFLDWDEADRAPTALAARLDAVAGPDLRLKMITNRGVKVYPDGFPETFCTDHWRCRFVSARDDIGTRGLPIAPTQVIELLARLAGAGLDFIKTEHLYTFDGERGYSLGQGE